MAGWIRFDHGYYIPETLKRLTDVMAWLTAWWIHFDHGYYIHGTLKRLMGVLAWLMAWWIREMSAKVVILAQFDNGYYIRGTLKRLADVFARLKAWWIRWLARFFAWLKGWWIRLSVKQVTDQESMSPLPRQRGNAHKSHDFGAVWPWILYPWDFEEVDGCFGLAHGLVDPYSKCMPLLPRREEMPARVVILAQFDHGYYIRGTLKRLTDVVDWLKAQWIRVSMKQVTDQKAMPLLPRQRGNVHKSRDFGSV
ncbi:hypothetical protein C8R44DRAFT_746985 [Mycena epipterygia]|nr:hypothetical protein C8R44DRAFT_746985 [Mycena epipterygia]